MDNERVTITVDRGLEGVTTVLAANDETGECHEIERTFTDDDIDEQDEWIKDAMGRAYVEVVF